LKGVTEILAKGVAHGRPGGENHPHGQEGGPVTPKHPKIKNKNKKVWVLALCGWLNHPQGPWDGFSHPYINLGGGPATPKGPKSKLFYLFIFFSFGL
jgi:hypothetical protein